VNRFGLTFHHFGLAVRSPDGAFRYLEGLGYTPGACAFDPLQSVNVAMRHHRHMPDVEVVWPGDGPSPIDQLVKRGNERIYHLCYASDDPAGSLAALEAAGLGVVAVRDPLPAILFGGALVSFHYVDEFGVIELLHSNTAGSPPSAETRAG
jgi:hypothetical protein